MLIELGTDRLSNLKRRTFKTVQGTVAGLLGLAGANGISPNIVKAENSRDILNEVFNAALTVE